MSEESKIPAHVAIIMDGNGRWAKQQGKERIWGHINGVESVRAAVRASATKGVKYLTLYAFSTENWGRPREEVDALMGLFCESVANEATELIKQGVKVAFIGDRSGLPAHVQQSLADIEDQTAQGKVLTLILALNYSSANELVSAVQTVAGKVADGELSPSNIDYKTITNQLYTAAYPDPDLLIRTSGEQRLSNFLLLQLAYAELYFTPTLWPDFREADFYLALDAYSERSRRYGLITQTEK